MSHPTPESLGLEAVGAGHPATARHVARCPTCRAELERLRKAALLLREAGLPEGAAQSPACLDEFAVADFVEGRLTDGARAAAVDHLLACSRCRSDVRAAIGLLAEAGTARARVRRRWAAGLGIAAAATVAVAVWPPGGEPPRLREPTITSTIAPVPIMPRGSVAAVERLVWADVPGAERYRLRIYDGEGTVVWATETADTVVRLPDSVALRPTVAYFWRIEAESGWLRWAASDLIEFRLTAGQR